jgi:hypothetical protein
VCDSRRLDGGFGDVGRGEADTGRSSLDNAPDADGLHLLLVVARALEDVGLPELTAKLRVHVEEHLANEVEVERATAPISAWACRSSVDQSMYERLP